MTDNEETTDKEIANPTDDVYEFLDTSELNDETRSLLQKYAGALVQYQPITQIAVGGASGWVVGCIFKKVGRVAASAIGGGMLMLQVAHQCGYISVNWNKVNRDMKNTKLHLPKEAYNRNAQSYANQIFKLVKHNAPITLGFAGGILLGIAT